jgi:two-component system sensor histidine kinase KdpD
MSALGDHVEIRVIDRGPGIPQAYRDQVFLPFQRLGDRDNESGVGLGLALSRGLAEAMGGSLAPESTPGGGLTMTLRLRSTVEVAVEAAVEGAVDGAIEGVDGGVPTEVAESGQR